VLSGGGF